VSRTKTLASRNPSEIPHVGISRCVFSTNFMADVDDQVDKSFKAKGKRAPFGDFRRSWWRYHCQQLGGTDACPYQQRDCALAFLRVAQLSIEADRPGAMFRVVAKDHAIKRLERKPLARDTQSTTALTRSDPRAVDRDQGQGDEPRPDQRLLRPASRNPVELGEDGQPVRRPLSRPVRIGTLLGGYNARPREVPTGDEPEGT
jgi:hypothetical protein